MHRIFEEISIVGSFPAITVSFLVVFLWGRAAIDAFKKVEKSSHDYFVLGVVLSFACGALDSVFWLFPWSLDYAGFQNIDYAWRMGVYFNVPLRQCGDLLSATFHVMSFITYVKETGEQHPAKAWLVGSVVFSLLFGYWYLRYLTTLT